MRVPVLLPNAIADLFAQATCSGQLTLADRYGILAAVMAKELDREERTAIDRMLYAVRRGRMQLADELSTSPC